jgi:hypothetical protein
MNYNKLRCARSRRRPLEAPVVQFRVGFNPPIVLVLVLVIVIVVLVLVLVLVLVVVVVLDL